MKSIVVSNRKGGSAKTTTAINLAAELAKKYSVLLIDFDTQGHATLGVGCAPLEEGGVHSIFTGKTLSESFLPTIMENLTLSPARLDFDVFEFCALDGVLRNRFEAECVEDFFDFCIIDTPPTHDALLKNALEVADTVIIPVIPHPLGVIAAQQMFRAIFQSSDKTNNKVRFVGALPVMYNPHIQAHKESLQRIYEIFGKERVFEPIGIDIALSEQFDKKQPLVLSEKRGRGREDYVAFTRELLKKIG